MHNYHMNAYIHTYMGAYAVYRAFPRLREVESEAERIPLCIKHVTELRRLAEQRAILLPHLPDLYIHTYMHTYKHIYL